MIERRAKSELGDRREGADLEIEPFAQAGVREGEREVVDGSVEVST